MNTFETNFRQQISPTSLEGAKLSDLASRYMQMFDNTNLKQALLGKRTFHEPNNIPYKPDLEINKSQGLLPLLENNEPLKKLFQNEVLQKLYAQNSQGGHHMEAIYSQINPNFSDVSNQLRQFRVPSLFNYMQNQTRQNEFNPFSPLELKQNRYMNDALLKLIGINDPISKHEDRTDTDSENARTTSSKSLRKVMTEQEAEEEYRREPALTEYTKTFPDWDVATIFKFLRSDKTQEAFEKELRTKVRRRRRRPKPLVKPPVANTTSNTNPSTNANNEAPKAV